VHYGRLISQPNARMSLIICSAADSGYFPLLSDLVRSIRAHQAGRAVPIGILDLGLDPDQVSWLQSQGALVVAPGWDVEFPGMAETKHSFRAQVSRPFLRKHFPNYELYLWVDADAWIQDWSVVELYLSVAKNGELAIATEIDRAYKRHYKRPKIFGWTLTYKCYRTAFGWRVAEKLGRHPMLNVGVFALRADAPHWDAWATTMTDVLQRTRFFFVEQIALNHAILTRNLPTNILPAYCNWMVGDAAPAYDDSRKVFTEPYAPYKPLGIVHLAGAEAKASTFSLRRLGGGDVKTRLCYSEAVAYLDTDQNFTRIARSSSRP
jgi:hypothetical protein